MHTHPSLYISAIKCSLSCTHLPGKTFNLACAMSISHSIKAQRTFYIDHFVFSAICQVSKLPLLLTLRANFAESFQVAWNIGIDPFVQIIVPVQIMRDDKKRIDDFYSWSQFTDSVYRRSGYGMSLFVVL